MKMEQAKPENPATMFDQASMERNNSLTKALEELKNLRPQLYSAAECCEKSYQCSKQKQMVTDNLKDYAMRALVNAVDHLGTVAYKLTEIIEQQTSDVSTMELKVTCMDQQLLTCQTYIDEEGLRQQRLQATISRHHKHYTLPAPVLGSVNKNVRSGSHIQRSPKKHMQTRPHVFLSSAPAANTLSWYLASEAKSKLRRAKRTFVSDEKIKSSRTTSGALDAEDSISKTTTSAARPWSLKAGPASSLAMQTLGIVRKDGPDVYKPMSPYKLFGNARRKTAHSKSAFSAFFVKQKARKLKTRS